MKSILIIIFLIFKIKFIYCEIPYDILSIDEAIDRINTENQNILSVDYSNIKKEIIQNITDNYIYLEIVKEPPNKNITKIDLIEKLNNIDINNIKYYDFFTKIFLSISSVLDSNLIIQFGKLFKYQYFLPFNYQVKEENGINYLYYVLNGNMNFYDNQTQQNVFANKDKKIKKINNKDPFDYIEEFTGNIYKNKHAQYTINFRQVCGGYLGKYPFNSSTLNNIAIEFVDGSNLKIDYKIAAPKKNLKNFINNDIYSFNENNFYFLDKGNIQNVNLNDIKWDYNYLNLTKYKMDEEKKVNVIYQRSFQYMNPLNINFDENIFIFFKNISKSINLNTYPIIVIEDLNSGGILFFSSLLKKILNHKIINTKNKLSVNGRDKNKLKKATYYDTETCEFKSDLSDIKEDKYSKETIHKRTKIFSEINYYIIEKFLEDIQKIERKPTEIIIFTDAFSNGITSFFIKDLQETGNAIIIGYNGNPSENKKKEKFDSSQSPSQSISFYNEKYQIYLQIPNFESFDDSYKHKDNIIPREYIINPIDERSSIYTFYDDSKYLIFINEGLNYFEKYKKECNKDNKKLLLLNDKCIFKDKNSKGGFSCNDNGLWNEDINKCKVSYCVEGYIFDTFNQTCVPDLCWKNGKFKDRVFIFLFVVSIIFLVLLVLAFFYVCFLKYNNGSNNTY